MSFSNETISARRASEKGRMARIVEARNRFIQTAVFEEGYLASEVAGFLACHPSNVSRALQKDDGVNRLRQV
jgi:hypothetical protein